MTLTFVYRWFKVMSTIALHSTMNISETINRTINSKWPMGNQWSRDRWRHVTSKGQTRNPKTLTAQYLENGRR